MHSTRTSCRTHNLRCKLIRRPIKSFQKRKATRQVLHGSRSGYTNRQKQMSATLPNTCLLSRYAECINAFNFGLKWPYLPLTNHMSKKNNSSFSKITFTQVHSHRALESLPNSSLI
ncbi:uncharacterized protein LOC121390738 [Gigantopelta aegis]|uniref:uncharacterized protein LOC121390738 n=1 Tax=Gigantopelta aegis TaxID=1735272 RepID=UPI001B88934A|nr:uncharacterized protein LOC121390738 [Gigantopelta aegis]